MTPVTQPVAAISEEQQHWKLADAASYDDFAKTYDQYIRILSNPLAHRICEIAALKPGMAVLDVGTGSGVAARRAAEIVGRHGHVLGIDLSKGMIAVARAAVSPPGGGTVEFRVMDAENIELPKHSFDGVISLCAVLHFPAVADAIGEMHRVLKPGGYLAVSFGHVRPIFAYRLAIYYAFEILRRTLRPVHPVLKAPEDLMTLVRSYELKHEEEPHTEWSQHRPHLRLVQEFQNAGIRNIRRDWVGHEWHCNSPKEFWDAQIAVATDVRKRLKLLPDQAQEEIQREYFEMAEAVLKRSGGLVYKYGTYIISGVKAA